ncbi:MAG: ribosomal protein L16 [Bilophila sp.]
MYQQIEAARIAMMRHIKRGGGSLDRVFPDDPITAKPLETLVRVPVRARRWAGALRSKPGSILYEIKGVSLELA